MASVKVNVRNEPYIVRFIPREEGGVDLNSTSLAEDPNFHIEHSSMYPTFADDIQTSSYCVGVDESYKNKEINAASFILCMYVYDKSYNERFVGFMIVKVLRKGTLYLDVLCTNTTKYKYVGSILMDYLEKIRHARKSRGILLNSIPEAVGFYERLGFQMEPKMNFTGMNIPDNVNLTYHSTHRMSKKNRVRTAKRKATNRTNRNNTAKRYKTSAN
jgi:hypothetical protein